MNILVTGHQGFIGNNLVGKLLGKDNFVVGIGKDKGLKKELENQPDVSLKGDMRDYNFVRSAIADYEIDEIYHFAAQSIVKTCANDPHSTFDINVMGTVTLLEACRNSGKTVKSVVVSTSDKAFGHAPIPYTEETPLKPLYVYETSKACQQFVTQCYANNFDLPTNVVACSNVYGPGDPNLSRIIPNTITRLAKGQPAQLNGGVAEFIREFVYVDDVSDAFMTVARKGKKGEVYCCGGTEHLRIRELMEKMCNLMGKDYSKDISIFQRPPEFKEIEEQYINSSKLQKLGWQPKTFLDEGLVKTIEYYTDFISAKE